MLQITAASLSKIKQRENGGVAPPPPVKQPITSIQTRGEKNTRLMGLNEFKSPH